MLLAVSTPSWLLIVLAVAPALTGAIGVLGSPWLQSKASKDQWLRDTRLKLCSEFTRVLNDFERTAWGILMSDPPADNAEQVNDANRDKILDGIARLNRAGSDAQMVVTPTLAARLTEVGNAVGGVQAFLETPAFLQRTAALASTSECAAYEALPVAYERFLAEARGMISNPSPRR